MNTEKNIWKHFEDFCKPTKRKYARVHEEVGNILMDWGFNMKRKNGGSDYKEGAVKTTWNVSAKLI